MKLLRFMVNRYTSLPAARRNTTAPAAGYGVTFTEYSPAAIQK